MKKENKRRVQLAPALVPVLLFALVLVLVIWHSASSRPAPPADLQARENTVANVLGQTELFLPGDLKLESFYENYTGIRNCRRIGAVALSAEQSAFLAALPWPALPVPEDVRAEILEPESDIYSVYEPYEPLRAAAQEADGKYLLFDRSGDGPMDGCAYWSSQFTLLVWEEAGDRLYFMTWDA